MDIAKEIKQNQDKDGMLRRLSEMSIKLYSDGAHFIYELLQNADDTGATKVKFIQKDDCLEFLHNGIPFTIRNLQSICDACNSDKNQNEETIGEFGIGFKSVFAICETVKIYSCPNNYREPISADTYPEFAIEIKDFYSPENIDKMNIENSFTTKFVFPYAVNNEFNRFETKDALIQQLKLRIKSLGVETMMFLHHICAISYEIDMDNYRIEKNTCTLNIEHINNQSEILSTCDNSKKYLKYSRKIRQSTKRTIDIAFLIDIDENGEYIFHKVDKPFVSVFFPTNTESKLDFLVQAPYKLTPDRSSVSSDLSTIEGKINYDLAMQTADLLRNIVIELRDKKKLNLSFWKLVPYDESVFYNFKLFKPIYDTIVELAQSEPVFPRKNGDYAKSNQLKLCRPQELSNVFDDSDLTKLLDEDDEYFWAPEITADKEPALHAYLIKTLKIEEITPEKLRKLISDNPQFLLNKINDDEWLVSFYTFLERVPALFQQSKTPGDTLLTVPIIKTQSGAILAPFQGGRKQLYT